MANANNPLNKVEGLRKSFGGNLVLDGVELDVHEHEAISIIGPSGTGKSTLLRCLNGLEEADEGSKIKVDGKFLAKDSIREIREEMQMLF